MAYNVSKFQRPKKYTFFSQGTGYHFNINKQVNYDGKLIPLLELHRQEVIFRNRPDTFILTDTGEVYPC